MATRTKPRRIDAGLQGIAGSAQAQGLAPTGEVHWNLVAPALDPGRHPPRRGPARRHGPVRRRHHAAHRPLAQRQVRREGTDHRRTTSTGARSTSRSPTRSSRRCCADVATYLNGATSCSSQDLYCGADPDVPPLRAATSRRTRGSGVRAQHVHPPRDDGARRRSTPNFTVLHAPEFAGRPGQARHAHQHVHRAQPRQAHDPHRRHALRRRAQEVDVHGHELLLPEAGRALHALLGEHRRRRATPRSSSASPAPARRRSRPTRSAPSSATTSTAGATERHVQLRGRLLREGDQPLARGRARHLSPRRRCSARSSRTSCSIRSRGR